MSNLDDIQINIIVNLQGLDSISRLTTSLGRLNGAQTRVGSTSKSNEAQNYRSIKSWDGLAAHLSAVQRNLDAIYRAGVHLSALGGDLTRFAQKIGGAGLDAANAWGDFEFALGKVAASSGIFSKQDKMYDALKTAIQDTSVALKFLPIDDITQAFYFWATTTGQTIKTQKDLRVAVEGVQAAVKTGIITNTSYETAIKGAYQIVKTYGKSLSDIPTIMAELHVETIRTSAEFNDLISAFSFMGPLASQLGVSFESMAGIVGRLSDLGIRASRAGRGLGMVMTILVRPTDKEKAALDRLFKSQLGVSHGWDKVVFKHGKFQGMEKLITNLAKATMNLTDQQKLNYLTTIFGTQNSARTILPLINAQIDALKHNNDIWKDSKYSVQGATEAWQKQWDLVSSGWKALTGTLQRGFDVIKLLIGEQIAKVLQPWIEKGLKIIKVVQQWIRENPKLVDLGVKIAAIVTIVLALAGAFFAFLGTLLLVGAGIAFVVQGFGGIFLAFGTLGAVVAAIAVGVAKNTGGILDAIKRFANEAKIWWDLLVNNTDKFRVDWIKIIDKIKPYVVKAFKAIADAINRLTDAMEKFRKSKGVEGMQNLADKVGLVLGAFLSWRAAIGVLSLISGLLWSTARAIDAIFAITKVFTGISIAAKSLSGLASLLSNIVRFLGPTGLVIAGIIAIITAAVVAYETNFGGFKDFVDGIVKWITDTAVPGILGFVDQIGTFFSDFITNVKTTASDFVTNAQTILAPAADTAQKLYDAWSTAFGDIANAVAGAWNNYIKPGLDAFMTAITEHVMPLLNELGADFQTIFSFISSVVSGALDNITTILSQIGDLFSQIFGHIVEIVTTDMADIAKSIYDFAIQIAPIVSGVLTFIITIFGSVFGGILKIVADVMATISDVIRGALEAIRGVIGIILGLIHGKFEEVWDGILGIIKGVWDAISGIVRGALVALGVVIDTGLAVITGIFDFVFGNKPGSIYASIHGFLDTIRQFGADIIKNISTGVGDWIEWLGSSLLGFIGQTFDGLVKNITSGKLADVLLGIGKDIVKGIWNGVLSLGGWIGDKVDGFIRDHITDPIQHALGIQSPSKVTAEIGRYIVQGLAIGITNNGAMAVAAMASTTASIANAARTGADQINMALDAATASASISSGLTIKGSNSTTVRLQVEVTSPDGSISQLDTQQIADLIKGPDLVTALEHMASVNN